MILTILLFVGVENIDTAPLKSSTKIIYLSLQMFERKNRLYQSYESKDMKVLRLGFNLKIVKLRQGLICNFRKFNIGLTEKIKG
jgi:hypothetical protein